MLTQKINDFFDISKPCPDEILNCKELRDSYFLSFNKLKASSCKSCDLIQLKNLYIAKIKFNLSPISFNKNIFYEAPKTEKKDKLYKKYIFLFPHKIVFENYKNSVKIISFKNNKQKIDIIKKHYFFWSFKKIFLFIFFNKQDFLLYFWFCNNVATKNAVINKINLKKVFTFIKGR